MSHASAERVARAVASQSTVRGEDGMVTFVTKKVMLTLRSTETGGAEGLDMGLNLDGVVDGNTDGTDGENGARVDAKVDGDSVGIKVGCWSG